MNKKFFMVCNSHLDPAWLWLKNEGIGETLSTFRIAADFCEKYDGFVFNHNESVLYEWVEEHEPETFAKIQKLVAEGKWVIMGGWYLQPDCVMTGGESLVRQTETGKRYFMEKFGVEPVTAVNFDPFGHSRGLVQVLKKSGYKHYVFMRPHALEIPDARTCGEFTYGPFKWVGFDGSELMGFKIYLGYNSDIGAVLRKLVPFVENAPDEENNLFLWGIGNHGGGPSKQDLEALAEYAKNSPHTFIHSNFEEYFATIDKDSLKPLASGLNYVFPGCYTSQVRIKQANRRVEEKLARVEKMLVQSGIEYDAAELKKAEKALLYCQFHDVLSGTCIKKGEENALQDFAFAETVIDNLSFKAFNALAAGQSACPSGEIPVLIYNPMPYEVESDFETEFQLGIAWDESVPWFGLEKAKMRMFDEAGNEIPVQIEKEDASFSLNWRKKISFHAKLAPMSMNQFRCKFELVEDYSRFAPCDQTDEHFIVETDTMRVKISKVTGLIDEYRVNGKSLLNPGSAAIHVYDDPSDSWLIHGDRFDKKVGEFKLASVEEANRINGYPTETQPAVRVIENNKVRTKIQAVFQYSASFAIVTYTIPKTGGYVDIRVETSIEDVCKMFKLSFDTALTGGTYRVQTSFGSESAPQDGRESVFQKWCGMEEGRDGFYILNSGTYGGSANGTTIDISLLRTAFHCAHPYPNRPLSVTDRYHDHMDIGHREFSFRLWADPARLEAEAEQFNQPPYVLSLFPKGHGESQNRPVTVSNQKVLLSAMKPAETGTLLRLFNTADSAQEAEIVFHGIKKTLSFTPFEIKTFVISGESFRETDMLGR